MPRAYIIIVIVFPIQLSISFFQQQHTPACSSGISANFYCQPKPTRNSLHRNAAEVQPPSTYRLSCSLAIYIYIYRERERERERQGTVKMCSEHSYDHLILSTNEAVYGCLSVVSVVCCQVEVFATS